MQGQNHHRTGTKARILEPKIHEMAEQAHKAAIKQLARRERTSSNKGSINTCQQTESVNLFLHSCFFISLFCFSRMEFLWWLQQSGKEGILLNVRTSSWKKWQESDFNIQRPQIWSRFWLQIWSRFWLQLKIKAPSHKIKLKLASKATLFNARNSEAGFYSLYFY